MTTQSFPNLSPQFIAETRDTLQAYASVTNFPRPLKTIYKLTLYTRHYRTLVKYLLRSLLLLPRRPGNKTWRVTRVLWM